LWIYNTGFSVDIQNYYPEIGYTSNQTCNNGPITLVSDSKCIHKDSCDIQFSSDCQILTTKLWSLKTEIWQTFPKVIRTLFLDNKQIKWTYLKWNKSRINELFKTSSEMKHFMEVWKVFNSFLWRERRNVNFVVRTSWSKSMIVLYCALLLGNNVKECLIIVPEFRKYLLLE
jgi:hypothetical protein